MKIDLGVRVRALEKHKEESGSGRLLRAASTFGASSGLVTSSWVTASRSGEVPSSNQGRNNRLGTSLRSHFQRGQRRPTHPLEDLIPSSSGTTSGWRFRRWARSDEVLPPQALSIV